MIAELFVEMYKLFAYVIVLLFYALLLGALFAKVKEKLIDMFGNELKNTDEKVRKAYVMKLDDEVVLKQVTLNDLSLDVRMQAVERICSKSVLEEIVQKASFPVSDEAKRKLNNSQ